MKILKKVSVLVALIISTNVNAALLERLGGQAVYDTEQNITWVADAGLAASNNFGVNGINADGSMHRDVAGDWITAMNNDGVSGYLGFNDWRLPTLATADSSCSLTNSYGVDYGLGCTEHELAHLYNVEAVSTSAPGLFENILANFDGSNYWYEPLAAPVNPGSQAQYWHFNFNNGYQLAGSFLNNYYALAVRDGDVAVVPVPAAAWLFGSGLIGLVSVARRRSLG